MSETDSTTLTPTEAIAALARAVWAAKDAAPSSALQKAEGIYAALRSQGIELSKRFFVAAQTSDEMDPLVKNNEDDTYKPEGLL